MASLGGCVSVASLSRLLFPTCRHCWLAWNYKPCVCSEHKEDVQWKNLLGRSYSKEPWMRLWDWSLKRQPVSVNLWCLWWFLAWWRDGVVPSSLLSEPDVGLPNLLTSGWLLHLHVVANALAMPGLLLGLCKEGSNLRPSLSVLAGSGAFSVWWFCMCALFQTMDAWAAIVPWPFGSWFLLLHPTDRALCKMWYNLSNVGVGLPLYALEQCYQSRS